MMESSLRSVREAGKAATPLSAPLARTRPGEGKEGAFFILKTTGGEERGGTA